MTSDSEEARAIINATLLLPRHAVKDLLSVGVCGQCIFRLFRIHGCDYSCPSLSASVLCSVLEEQKCCSNSMAENDVSNGIPRNPVENGFVLDGVLSGPYFLQESESEPVFCNICLGILQFSYNQEQKKCTSCKRETHAYDFAVSIAEIVKREGHQIDSFSLEVSIPPVVLANERAIWLYMKKKYGSEDWFPEKFLIEHVSVKDALKLSITKSLETLLAVKSGVSSFRIRLTYTHTKASLKLLDVLEKDHGCKRRKTGPKDSVIDDLCTKAGAECMEQSNGELDVVIHRTLNDMHDETFFENFMEKVYQPCHLASICYKMPIYVGGRYLKYSRNVSQTRWIIDDERMGEASVEEIVGSNVLLICRGDSYKFHAAGREDIDVRMLGSGRPFLVEVLNARRVPSSVEVAEIKNKINSSENRLVMVRNLQVVGNQAWTLMREGETEKQKQYAALVWISRPLKDEDIQSISSLKEMDILQGTPIRVLHRRSPLERKRIIHWMKVERIVGNCQYFLLHLCSQAGTYIKEFVHGDLGRTNPSIGSMLGCRAEILQLDVTDVKMDCF